MQCVPFFLWILFICIILLYLPPPFFLIKGKTQGIGRTRTFAHILHIKLRSDWLKDFLQVIRLRSTDPSLVTLRAVTREKTLRPDRASRRWPCTLSRQSYLLFRSVTRAVKPRYVHTLWSCFSLVDALRLEQSHWCNQRKYKEDHGSVSNLLALLQSPKENGRGQNVYFINEGWSLEYIATKLSLPFF